MNNDFSLIIDKIKKYNNIVLLVHENPDGDAVGSIIAVYKALSKIGKNVFAFIEREPVNCTFLLETIGKEIKTFEAIDFCKKYELCIALDCGDLSRIGNAKDLFINACDTICIDHHETNLNFANANYVEPEAAATGEIIYDLLNALNIEIDSEIATALYTAIASDTGNFVHNNTTKKSFEIAGNLMNYKIDITKISYHLFSETSMNRLIFMGKLLQNVEVFLEGKLAILTATSEDIEKFNIEPNELEGMVDYARYIKGVEVGVMLKPKEDYYRVSMRSNGKVDVSRVAQSLNGGGHKFAAGCRVSTTSVNEAKDIVINIFKAIF